MKRECQKAVVEAPPGGEAAGMHTESEGPFGPNSVIRAWGLLGPTVLSEFGKVGKAIV